MEKLHGILIVCIFNFININALEIVNQWNLLSFDFPQNYDTSNFRPENSVFTGLEVTDTRLFISIPRLRPGVPATLTSIPINTPPGSSPVLRAYPDWSYHSAGRGEINCSGLISVYRTKVDACNRLWVLDAGTLDTLQNFTRVCPPKLAIFDLNTDQLTRIVMFPNDVLRPASLLSNLIVDESVQGKCDSAFVYMSDTIAPGLVVYDSVKDRTWRFSHPTMFPNPDYSQITIGADSFSLMDGIIGLTHSPKQATLFYQPVATDRIFSVPTSILRQGPPGEFDEFPVSVAGRKSSQGLPLAMNLFDDTLYFSPLSETSIASWNVVTNQQSVLAQDPVNLEFVAGLRWKEDGSLWVLSSRFNKFFKRTVSAGEINLRVIRIPPPNVPRRNSLNANIPSTIPYDNLPSNNIPSVNVFSNFQNSLSRYYF